MLGMIEGQVDHRWFSPGSSWVKARSVSGRGRCSAKKGNVLLSETEVSERSEGGDLEGRVGRDVHGNGVHAVLLPVSFTTM
jgi:hypothetical protein